ncbi:MAG: hypothetical protein AB7O67_23170 [Vicinamibacterales bacterium]
MHLFRRFIATPALGPEDGAMSGGADPIDTDTGGSGEPGDVEAFDGDGGDGDDADDHEGQGTSPEDEDEELLFGGGDDQDEGRPAEERLKALSASHKKLKRRFGKFWPLAKTLKAAGVSDRDVPALIQKAQNFDALARRAGGDPQAVERLMALVRGEAVDDSTGGKSTSRRGGDQDAVEFDESTLPFDPNANANNRFFADEIKRGRTVEARLQTALKRIEALEGGIRSEKQTRVQQEWSSAMNAAAKHIPDPGLRTLFTDAVKATFQLGGARLKPQQVIDHYLKQAGITPGRQKVAAAAARQRLANGNQQLPRNQAGVGAPSPARSGKERLADVHKRLRTAG